MKQKMDGKVYKTQLKYCNYSHFRGESPKMAAKIDFIGKRKKVPFFLLRLSFSSQKGEVRRAGAQEQAARFSPG